MNVTCPACQADQEIGNDMAGIEVRCPSCQQVFQTPVGAEDDAVAPGWPDANPTPTRKRPLQLDLDDPFADITASVGITARNRVDLGNDAMAQTWFASQVMFAAGFFTAANLVYNIYQFLANRPAAAGPLAGPALIGFLIGNGIFVVMLACVFAASQSLYWLGARWRIIVAIVVNLVFALLLAAGAAFNVYVFTTVNVVFPMATVLITIAANASSSALNLMAAILAIRTLANSVVNAAYQSQHDAAAARENSLQP